MGQARRDAFASKLEKLVDLRRSLEQVSLTPQEAGTHGIRVKRDGRRRTGLDLLSFPDVSFEVLSDIWPELQAISPDIAQQVANDALYANYFERQSRDAAMIKRDENHRIPAEFEFSNIEGLSNEIKSKLALHRPESLADAAKIDGITPAALTLILANLRKSDRKSA